jgi:hypothetical protein
MENTQAHGKKPSCHFISKIGARCHADPQTGKDYCFFHDPGQKKKQTEARRQGGEARSRQAEPEITLAPNLPVIPLWRAADVGELLAKPSTTCAVARWTCAPPATSAISPLSCCAP